MASVSLVFGSAAMAETYQLGVNDRLNIRVYQWISAEGVVLDWPSASGEFVVGPEGTISVPLLGEIEADGQTTSLLATVIADELLQKYALTDPPSVSVEIAKFRPFFIGGDVMGSGQYDYIPGLTVGQAVTLAGGTVDMSRNTLGENRIFLNATGSLRLLQAERDRLLVKRARLDAEENGLQSVVAPDGVSSPTRLDLIMAEESDILKTRILQLASDLDGLERQKNLLQAEVEALEDKEDNLARQREIGEQELEQSQQLISRGLAASTRVNEDERYLVDVDSRILDLSTQLLRARQGIAEVEAEAAALQVERDAEVYLESQKIDAELEEIERRMVTDQSIITQAAGNIAEMGGPGMQLFSVEYRISRREDGQAVTITVDEWAEVKPGDVLNVRKSLMPMQ
ncbi:polysaccharide biosynthesis/export family protein [Sulfitobacter sp. 1151]|uniref:Polysaccharide biosynthesis/export family protein n=1 Tax=Parasulfitobacter algicola TaxID=2614809 RepID=A0ABX2IPU1_9RHOB|nr:polysaccharide biosynthesis/export family protein [Sulfitobacter algicola]NSX54904.1 polysaccharide biosynthesis/export family protein [Sulfitobacter algicola]